jgi:tetratricopeptide (TPR) repeat protein
MFKAVVMLVALAGLYQVGAWADGAPMPSSGARSMTPEEMAVEAYNSGIGRRDRGLKAEQQAATDKRENDRARNEKRAKEEYERALKDFAKATELNPNLAQAHNGAGFAYRKLGDYDTALASYDRALQLAPSFPEAIEYRGEAYLALNRLEDAKQAYLALFGMDRKQADLFMKAMTAYVAKKKADPAGVDPAALSAFETWINERAGIAGETQAMALSQPHIAWQ